jgi:hypothetical protein
MSVAALRQPNSNSRSWVVSSSIISSIIIAELVRVMLGLVDAFDAALAAVLARSPAPASRNAGDPTAPHGRRAARRNDSVSV